MDSMPKSNSLGPALHQAKRAQPHNLRHTSASDYQPYCYTPLKHPDEIRLLIIEPGRQSEPVQCNLLHIRLSHQPSYEALSYTWGTEETPSKVFCGKDGHILVTQNCFQAIRRLRYTDGQRTVWIDAVCIDQPSIAERGHQVAIMPSIYQQASKVIVYLGESAEDSDLAMEYLKSYAFIDDDATSSAPSESQLALGRLISRPWFSRLWVLQEIFMSASAGVLCGDKCVHWACFRRLAKWNPQNSLHKMPRVMSINRYAGMKDPSIQDFFKLLCNTRDCGCKDPRDRIFALFSMGPKDLPKTLGIDYTVSTETVFTNAAVYFMNSIGLDALCGVDGRQENSSLPSWVPDWRIPVHSTSMMDLMDQSYSAGEVSRMQLIRFIKTSVAPHETVLQTLGHIFATVKTVGDVFLPGRSSWADVVSQAWDALSAWYEDAEPAFDDYVHRDGHAPPLPVNPAPSLSYMHIFLQTLYMEANQGISWTPRLFKSLGDDSDMGMEAPKGPIRQERKRDHELGMVDVWGKLNQELTCESFPFAKRKRLYSCCTGRRLALVRSKHLHGTDRRKKLIGLVPAQTQPTDEIFLLKGARCPFVLRREVDFFVLIGPCFVWEGMDRRSPGDRFEEIKIR